MKKSLLLLLILPLLFSNCRKEDNVLFEMVYTDDFVIPAGLNPVLDHFFILRDIPIGTYFTANNIDPAELNAINPRSARLFNIFSGSGNYDFIDRIYINIFTDDINDGREIFYREVIPFNTGDELEVIPSLHNIQPFMQNTKFNVEIHLKLRAAPQQTLDTRFQFVFGAK